MPLLGENGIGLALPRSTLLFCDISWHGADSGGFWGWGLCITPTGIQCLKTHNTTINQHRRVVSITGGWEWCSFLTNRPWFSSFSGWWNVAWLDVIWYPNKQNNNKQQWIVENRAKKVHRKRTFNPQWIESQYSINNQPCYVRNGVRPGTYGKTRRGPYMTNWDKLKGPFFPSWRMFYTKWRGWRLHVSTPRNT